MFLLGVREPIGSDYITGNLRPELDGERPIRADFNRYTLMHWDSRPREEHWSPRLDPDTPEVREEIESILECAFDTGWQSRTSWITAVSKPFEYPASFRLLHRKLEKSSHGAWIYHKGDAVFIRTCFEDSSRKTFFPPGAHHMMIVSKDTTWEPLPSDALPALRELALHGRLFMGYTESESLLNQYEALLISELGHLGGFILHIASKRNLASHLIKHPAINGRVWQDEDAESLWSLYPSGGPPPEPPNASGHIL
ncbi:hypothetical protein KQI84_10685 [bacterium]|nr:hypothetical protein [bacterium]